MHTYMYGEMAQTLAVSVVSKVRPIRSRRSIW